MPLWRSAICAVCAIRTTRDGAQAAPQHRYSERAGRVSDQDTGCVEAQEGQGLLQDRVLLPNAVRGAPTRDL